MKWTPLLNDDLAGEPTKRALEYIQSKKEQGHPIVGVYCGYAPIELLHAMEITPAVLCAFSKIPIPSAESVLPTNLCPLIKSSYGFILEGTCPFFSLSQAVVGETTCDGKKKMFELAAQVKPMHVMDLPQLANEPEALDNWTLMLRKLQKFLENQFKKTVSEEEIEIMAQKTNRKNHKVRKIFHYAASTPPLVHWQELMDVSFLAQIATPDDIDPLLDQTLSTLERRNKSTFKNRYDESFRVLVTGCPVGGDALKIFNIIEACHGTVVVSDACSGIKPFMGQTQENTSDPYRAIAKKYLDIPCACMTPNTRRLEQISNLIDTFQPRVVIDFILTACHGYNVESYKVGQHVSEHHGLPYLKIESDYYDNDDEQIRTRIEALFEMTDK